MIENEAPPEVVYREGNDVDPDAVVALRARTDFADIGREKVAGQIAGARHVVTAWHGERLVGFARAISDGVTNGYISSVMVDPDYQRRGIGRAMLERITAGRTGIRWVLHVRHEAVAFYRSVGVEAAPDIMWRDRRG